MAEISYKKTEWRNNVTPLNEKNMNNIENGIEALDIALGTKADKSYVDTELAKKANIDDISDLVNETTLNNY